MLRTDPFTLFSAQPTRAVFVPPADATVREDDVVLTMDLPGLTADDLDIEVADGYLSVRGERARPELGENTRWAHAERAFGRFERRIKMPDGVDPDKITARMADGVLSLIVPKPERMIPRTVPIGTEQRELETSTA
jgi:HSP20 family protein